jgi:hypothetical protein
MWDALSDEKTVLSFIIVAGPRQHSHSQDWRDSAKSRRTSVMTVDISGEIRTQ